MSEGEERKRKILPKMDENMASKKLCHEYYILFEHIIFRLYFSLQRVRYSSEMKSKDNGCCKTTFDGDPKRTSE
jgi:hypothetical protein